MHRLSLAAMPWLLFLQSPCSRPWGLRSYGAWAEVAPPHMDRTPGPCSGGRTLMPSTPGEVQNCFIFVFLRKTTRSSVNGSPLQGEAWDGRVEVTRGVSFPWLPYKVPPTGGLKKQTCAAPLVAQWQRTRLNMQEILVWSLIWEDPTWHRAAQARSHNYQAYRTRVQEPQLRKSMCPRARAPWQEKPPQWEAFAPPLESSPQIPQLEKSPRSSEDPAQPKINKLKKKKSRHVFFHSSESQKPEIGVSAEPHFLWRPRAGSFLVPVNF